MNINETAIQTHGPTPLIGVMTTPAAKSPRSTAVLLLNAGLIHRIGPNRFYVKMARHLAQKGFVVCRFDLSGIGDSSARQDRIALEPRIVDDTQQVMELICQTQGIARFILIGHCSGAAYAMLLARHDPRVTATVMINPEGGDEGWTTYDRQRKTVRYYENYLGQVALRDPQKWRRFLTGQVSYRNLLQVVFQNLLWNRLSARVFKLRTIVKGRKTRRLVAAYLDVVDEILAHDTRMLYVYAENSSGWQQMKSLLGPPLKARSEAGGLDLQVISNADHTFTLLENQRSLFEVVSHWCLNLQGAEA